MRLLKRVDSEKEENGRLWTKSGGMTTFNDLTEKENLTKKIEKRYPEWEPGLCLHVGKKKREKNILGKKWSTLLSVIEWLN